MRLFYISNPANWDYSLTYLWIGYITSHLAVPSLTWSECPCWSLLSMTQIIPHKWSHHPWWTCSDSSMGILAPQCSYRARSSSLWVSELAGVLWALQLMGYVISVISIQFVAQQSSFLVKKNPNRKINNCQLQTLTNWVRMKRSLSVCVIAETTIMLEFLNLDIHTCFKTLIPKHDKNQNKLHVNSHKHRD